MEKGIQLIELMIVLAILAILLSLALPGWQRWQAQNRLSSAFNDFNATLRLARSTAILTEQAVTLCPSSDAQTCSDRFQAWQDGYLVFIDQNNDRQRNDDESLVAVHHAVSGIKIQSTSRYRARITFLPQGRSWFSNTHFKFCSEGFEMLNRALILSNNGRFYNSNQTPDGSPVRCF